MMLEDYDGITPTAKVSLTSLCYLAKISDLPLALKEPKTIAFIASTMGTFIELDYKLFQKRVRLGLKLGMMLEDYDGHYYWIIY